VRLKDYGRNPNHRKVYVQSKGLLMIGVDIGKSSHSACFGTKTGTVAAKFEFTHDRAGFDQFERAIRQWRFTTQSKRVLIGMEPSGIYWYSLYERLKRCGFGVCLVNCLAVKNNRRTMSDGASKTDPKDAHSVYDLLAQGKFFLPVARDSELAAAYRLMRRHMAVKKRVHRLRNQIRGALHLSFPELNALIKDLTMPTSLRFLQANPTPACIMRNGRKRFLNKWRTRARCGQWKQDKFVKIYDLAKHSIGLKDPHRIDALEIKAMAHDLADAVAKTKMWLDQAILLVEHREDFNLLLSMPRIGKPTAVALLTAIGNIDEYTYGKQLVKLAGLDVRLYQSGTSIKKRPRVTHIGSGFLRHWLYHYGLRLVAFEPNFKQLYLHKRQQSPGKGAGQRALVCVNDKVLRIVFRMLKENTKYCPTHDKLIAAYYKKQKKAA
jgi:transposase